MDTVITFTPNQFLACVAAVCGAITGVAAVIGLVMRSIHKFKAPNIAQDKRLDKLEKRVEALETSIDAEYKRVDSIEQGSHITQRAILALLKHGIDGNEITAMEKSRDELEKYLTDK